MRITYYEETDSAIIVLREPGEDTVGEIAGENAPEPAPESLVLHRDDAGELYEIEIYSGASKRLTLDKLDFKRVSVASSESKAGYVTTQSTLEGYQSAKDATERTGIDDNRIRILNF